MALTEAVSRDGRVVIESTANGMGNFLHELWNEAKSGENNYTPHFYTWWQDPEYRFPGQVLEDLSEEEVLLQRTHQLSLEQLAWRREKQRDLRASFPQEYPEDDVTCFLAGGRCCFDTRALPAAEQRIAGEPEPESLTRLVDRDANALAVTPAGCPGAPAARSPGGVSA